MTKKFISLPFTLTLIVISVALLSFTHFTACASQLHIDGNNLIVEASGRGRTMTAAKIDARRNAAQQALGFMLEGTTLFETISENGRNESKLEEKILRLTRALQRFFIFWRCYGLLIPKMTKQHRHHTTRKNALTMRFKQIADNELSHGENYLNIATLCQEKLLGLNS